MGVVWLQHCEEIRCEAQEVAYLAEKMARQLQVEAELVQHRLNQQPASTGPRKMFRVGWYLNEVEE